MTVVVASGKGGTGKTTVAVALARSLAGDVALLDCDVDAPNTHLFLNDAEGGAATGTERRVSIAVPRVADDACTGCGACARFCRFGALAVARGHVLVFDDLCHGCGGCTRVCPTGAITEVPFEIGTVRRTVHEGLQGAPATLLHVAGELDVGQTLAPPVVRAVLDESRSSGATTVVIDAAPGTTCPVVEAARGADVGLLVTENTPFGLHDLELAAQVFSDLSLPAAIVLNRAGIGHKDELELTTLSRRFGFPVLMRIPYSAAIATAYANGVALTETVPTIRREFRRLAGDLDALAQTSGREARA